MAKAEVRKQCVRYFQIVLGCFIVCMGFNLFLIQAHLLTGGLSGVALIIYYLAGIPVGMQNLAYNLPIIYVAYRVFGKLYALDTILIPGGEFRHVSSSAVRAMAKSGATVAQLNKFVPDFVATRLVQRASTVLMSDIARAF